MHTSTKTIARALLCTALLSSLVPSALAAADAAADKTAAEKNLATALAGPIAKKILDDKNAIKDQAVINKMIDAGIAATDYANVPNIAKAVREQVLAQVKGPYGAAAADALVQSSAAAVSSTAAVKPTAGNGEAADTAALQKFDTPFSSKAVLTTAHIVSAYAPIFQTSTHPTGLGVQFSASLPAGASSLRDYANSELLLRDGGFFNAYFSFGAIRPSDWKNSWGDRRYALNRRYFLVKDLMQLKLGEILADGTGNKAAKYDQDQVYGYLTHGIGLKAVKTSLDKDNLALTGVGSAYVGIGMDGPLIPAEKSVDSSSTGSMSLELVAAGNATSKRALKALYGANNPTFTAKTSFLTWGATARFYVADKVFVSVAYYKPIDRSARDLIHEVTTFSIGYNSGAGAKKDPAKNGDAGKDQTK